MKQAHSFNGFGIMQGGSHGTFSGAGFATDLVAVQENIFGAGMAEDIDAGIAGDLFGTVAPEDDFLLQIEDDDADLQAIQDVAVDLGIFKVRHGATGIWVLLCSSAGKHWDLRSRGEWRESAKI